MGFENAQELERSEERRDEMRFTHSSSMRYGA